MIFSSKAIRRGLGAVAGVFGSLVLLASCGGGTSQYDPFLPERLLVFGDDNSALTSTGRRYGVNGLTELGEFDCSLEPIWVQQVATLYGFVFAECNPQAVQQPKARMLATPGAKVSDVVAQVEAQVASGGFRAKDMATVLVGGNDIIELYGRYPVSSEDTLLAEARGRGQRAAQIVNRLVNLGVKVIVSDLPDMGITPFAYNENRLASGGFDRAALLSRLTTAFNEQLGVNLIPDGRSIGLVQAQLQFQAIGRAPEAFGYNNIIQGACATTPPACTTATLLPEVATGGLAGYLWADDTRLSPSGHGRLASLAVDRAQRNPF